MLTLVLLSLFVLITTSHSRSISPVNYAIIFDGGSKGTRLNLFSIRLNDNTNNQLLYQEEIDINLELYCELNDNGLGSYQNDTDVSIKFNKCMEKARQLIPIDKHSETLIALGATAGLRLLEIKDRYLSDTIQRNVRSYFKKTGFLYSSDAQVRVLTGSEEGAFAWISANYLTNKITNLTPNYPETSYGILDIGGSSAQISFLAREDPSLNNFNLEYYYQNFELKNSTFRTYSTSYLCYGTQSILNMYYASKIKEANYSNDQIKISCLPEDAIVEVKAEDLLESPCINGLMFSKNEPFTIDTSLLKAADKFTLLGNAKKDKCRIEIENLIPKSVCPYGGDKCSFNGIYSPKVKNFKFLALSNFWEAYDYTQRLYNVNLDNNLLLFNQTTYTLCNEKYSSLKSLNDKNKVGVSKNRLAKLCVENVYIIHLLDLLGFKTYQDLDFVEKINDKQTSWALGYLIFLLNNNHL